MTDLTALPHDAAERVATAARVLAGDDSDERACAEIPAAACMEEPRNFRLALAGGAASRLAEQIASPALVLPWLLAGIGAPATLVGLLLPLRQAGALAALLAGAAHVRAVPERKWVWVAADLFRALMLTMICAGAMLLPVELAAPFVLLAFAVFSVAGGVGTLAGQDVLGKTIPRGLRGRLLSRRAQIGGALTLGVALAFRLLGGEENAAQIAVPLIALAALLWALGAWATSLLAEQPGATEGGRTLLHELRAGRTLLRDVTGFRRFVLARGLLLGVELATPFLALHASERYGGGASLLGTCVLALGAAGLLAGPLWGRWLLLSSRLAMAAAGALATAAGVLALGLGALFAGGGGWVCAPAFLLLGLAEAALRLGRKTYLNEGAPASERLLYTALANTAAAALAVGGGLVGLLADLTVPAAGVAAVSALAAAGTYAAWRLPEARDMALEVRSRSAVG